MTRDDVEKSLDDLIMFSKDAQKALFDREFRDLAYFEGRIADERNKILTTLTADNTEKWCMTSQDPVLFPKEKIEAFKADYLRLDRYNGIEPDPIGVYVYDIEVNELIVKHFGGGKL